jgi:transcription initiation factor TFIIF subunit beta
MKKRRNEDTRRDRLPEEQALQLIFRAYETKTNWSLNEMAKQTNQPAGFVKELLNKVGSYVPSGPHKSTYQLKPEFAVGSAPSEASTSSKLPAK